MKKETVILVVVIAFLGTECPLAKLYGPRLASLGVEAARRYAEKLLQ